MRDRRIGWRGAVIALAVAAPCSAVAAQRPAPPAVPTYPAWFLSPPAGTAAVIVPRYARLASSWQVARDSATEALGRMVKVRVRVVQRATDIEGVGLDLEPSDVQELTSAAPDSVVVLDTVARAGAAFLLGAAVARPVDAPRTLVAPAPAAPAWVGTPPAGLAAVGSAPMYANEDGSWWEAEQRARAALAAAERVKARSAQTVTNGEALGLLLSEVKTDLFGARVVARWRDARTVHVLVQADGRQEVP